MRFSILVSSLLLTQSSHAFTVSPAEARVGMTSKTTTALNLFGGGGKKNENKGPGMMDQLAMFKKAQEMAQKKKKLDEELQAMDFVGEVPGKVKVNFKYVPVLNPMDPSPDYEPTKFEFDDSFFNSASPTEIAEAAKEAISNGIDKTNQAVVVKYQTLQQDLMEAFGQKK